MAASEDPHQPRAQVPAAVREKICEACGQTFECHAGGCWCGGVSLTDETRTQLRARYGDCLCPACLSSHQTTI